MAPRPLRASALGGTRAPHNPPRPRRRRPRIEALEDRSLPSGYTIADLTAAPTVRPSSASIATAQLDMGDKFGFDDLGPAANRRPLVLVMLNVPERFYSPNPSQTASGDIDRPMAYYHDLLFATPGRNVNDYFRESSRNSFEWQESYSFGPETLPEFMWSDFPKWHYQYDDVRYLLSLKEDIDWNAFDTDNDFIIETHELGVVVIDNVSRTEGYVRAPNQAVYTGGLYFDQPQLTWDGYWLNFKVAEFGYQAAFATIAHELSHLLDTVDLYGGNGNNNNNYGLSLMGATIGTNEYDDMKSFHLDPWHRVRLGWDYPIAYPLVPSQVGATTISTSQRPIVFYDPNRGPNEFYMMEFRDHAADVYDSDVGFFDHDGGGAVQTGIALWYVKVDENGGLITSMGSRLDLATTDPGRDLTMNLLTSADGVISPRWLDGGDTGLRIEIGAPSDGRVNVAWSVAAPFTPVISAVGNPVKHVGVGQRIELFGAFPADPDSYDVVLESGPNQIVLTRLVATPTRLLVEIDDMLPSGACRLRVVPRADLARASNAVDFTFAPFATRESLGRGNGFEVTLHGTDSDDDLRITTNSDSDLLLRDDSINWDLPVYRESVPNHLLLPVDAFSVHTVGEIDLRLGHGSHSLTFETDRLFQRPELEIIVDGEPGSQASVTVDVAQGAESENTYQVAIGTYGTTFQRGSGPRSSLSIGVDVRSFRLVTSDNADTVTVLALQTRTPTQIETNRGADTVRIGDRDSAYSVNLDDASNLDVDMGGGTGDQLIVDARVSPRFTPSGRSYRVDGSGVYHLYEIELPNGVTVPITSGLSTRGVDSVTLFADDANDRIEVERGGVVIHAGRGDDRIYVAPRTKSLLNAASVTIHGEGDSGGGDHLFLDDSSNRDPLFGGGESYTVTETAVTRLAALPAYPNFPIAINYTRIDALRLDTAPGINTFHVIGTPGQTAIHAAAGINTFLVGSAEDGVDRIAGALTLDVAAGLGLVAIDDRSGANLSRRFYDLSHDEEELRLDINFARKITGRGLTSLALSTSEGIDIVRIDSTRVPTRVASGAGADAIFLASNAHLLSGVRALSIDGGPDGATVELDDTFNAPGDDQVVQTTIGPARLTQVRFPVAQPDETTTLAEIGFSNVTRWTIATGPARDRVVIGSSADFSINTGPGLDEAAIDLNALGSGRVELDGGPDGAELLLDDSAAPDYRKYEFRSLMDGPTRHAVGRTGEPGVVYANVGRVSLTTTAFGDVVTLGPALPGAAIELHGGEGNDLLIGGPFTNEFHITGPDSGQVLQAPGTPTFDSFEHLTGGQFLDYFLFDDGGTLTGRVDGGGGTDAIRGPSVDNLYDLTGMNAGTLDWDGLAAPVRFAAVESIVGFGPHDHFIVRPGAGALSLDGHNGFDTIDYSSWTTPVVLSLTDKVGPTSAIHGFEHVIGGKGDDILIGDTRPNYFNHLEGGPGQDILVGGPASDTLKGGDGRDVLIGGAGADTLDGGEGDDLIIGGRATFALDLAILDAIRDEWAADSPYALRVVRLRRRLNKVTVVNDVERDEMIGGAGLDWFWADRKIDSLPDLDRQRERVN